MSSTNLRAVPVKAVDGRAVSVLRCLSEELLEQAILLFGGVAGEVQWNEQVVVRRQGCHSHRIPRASAQWTLRDVSASAGISAVRGGESCCSLGKALMREVADGGQHLAGGCGFPVDRCIYER